ncbi:unnamed protein product [Dovyalis caffra]|uniref:Uncharacterized protein n=1 Tax=Dovyalis caffra TaxID=77055 RepID=A0AAV1QZT0_9ROSI|nr:unnamed protein product [Dovyalis caffra]
MDWKMHLASREIEGLSLLSHESWQSHRKDYNGPLYLTKTSTITTLKVDSLLSFYAITQPRPIKALIMNGQNSGPEAGCAGSRFE